MVQIIPAILATSEEQFKKDLDKIQNSGLFNEGWIHIDFADNIFVPNQTIGPSELANHPIKLKKEAHLMIKNPEEMIDQLTKLGFERIITHIESDVVKPQKCLALNPETQLDQLKPYFKDLEAVLLMGVHPGFQGQGFLPEVIEKIKECKKMRDEGGFSFQIGVDGAVSKDNAKLLVMAGVDYLVVGSYLLKGDIGENQEMLWEAVNG